MHGLVVLMSRTHHGQTSSPSQAHAFRLTLAEEVFHLGAVDPVAVPAAAAKEEPNGALALLARIGLQRVLVLLALLAHLETPAPVPET